MQITFKRSKNIKTTFNFLFIDISISIFSMNKVLIGSNKLLWNPAVKPFCYQFLSNICIFSFERMYYCYRRALLFLFKLFYGGRNRFALFVNGLPYTSGSYFISKYSTDYFRKTTHSRVAANWIPGILTNMHTIVEKSHRGKRKKIKKLHPSSFCTFTEKKLDTFKKKNEFLISFRFPDVVIFLSSSFYFSSAVKESFSIGVPSLGIVDSDGYFNYLSFPIAGNDDSLQAVLVYIKIFSEAIFRGTTKCMFTEAVIFSTAISSDNNQVEKPLLDLCLDRKALIKKFQPILLNRLYINNIKLYSFFLDKFKMSKKLFNFYDLQYITKMGLCLLRTKNLISDFIKRNTFYFKKLSDLKYKNNKIYEALLRIFLTTLKLKKTITSTYLISLLRLTFTSYFLKSNYTHQHSLLKLKKKIILQITLLR